jgi:hypothetical protein
LNLIEKLYAKESYHSLEIVASSEVSLPDIMDVFKKRNLKVKHFMYELDHENKTLSSRFVFRFFERSLRTNSYQDLMNDFEDAKLKIKRIKWTTQ